MKAKMCIAVSPGSILFEVEDMFNGWLAFNLNLPNGSSPVQFSFTNPLTGNPVTINQDVINPHGLYTQFVAAGITDNVRNTSILVDSSHQIVTGVRDPLLPPNTAPTVVNDSINIDNIDNSNVLNCILPRSRHPNLRNIFKYFIRKTSRWNMKRYGLKKLSLEEDNIARPGRWYNAGKEETVRMLQKTGYRILSDDMSLDFRSPIIHFIKP